ALRYSTYVGGDGDDAGTGIALDESGRAYLTGFTSSANFPTTPGAFDASVNGSRDVFITKLDAAGAALVYSTYLGGGCDDNGQAVAVDAGGSAYVTGTTCSKDFPTTIGAFDTSVRGQNAFVTKMNIAGTAPVYSTYLGGDFLSGLHGDTGGQIAVDADGSAYVTGTTISIDFPTTIGAFKTNRTAFLDAFVTKLDATGSALVYSTYLGGSDQDYGNGIAVDAVGSAYVTGNTSSADFPTTLGAFAPYFYRPGAFVTKLDPAGAALVYSTYLGSDADAEDIAVDGGGNAYVTGSAGDYFPTTIGAFDPLSNGYRDAFVTKLDAAGAALVYSTYLGGSDFDSASGIAIDANGSAYVTGSTRSLDFPITVGAFDTAASTSGDAFVTKLDPAGAVLLYSTFLGGRESEGGTSIAVDASGRAYVTGITHSDDFPTTAGAFDTTANGGDDVFLTKLDAAGAAVVYSTYLGGIRDDHALAIEIDASGSAYVTGRTFSWNFPTTAGAVDRIWSGGADVFVTKVDATGALTYSTFLGGSGDEWGTALALDASGNVYVTGTTSSFNFPTTEGAFDRTFSYPADAFVAKIAAIGVSATLTLVPQTAINRVDQLHCVTATLRDPFGIPIPGVIVRFSVNSYRSRPTESVRTGPNGNALFCYSATLPWVDLIIAHADFDGDAFKEPGEPAVFAHKAWVPPPSTPGCGQVTGLGLQPIQGLATFSIDVRQDPSSPMPRGEVIYTGYFGTGTRFQSTTISSLIIAGKLATIIGEGTVNGGPVGPFRVDVTDGVVDTLTMTLFGYLSQSVVIGQVAVATCN
ncbi:MAG: hypothetical protein DMF87_16810, partial [Acidobacteria bacterium]